MKTYRKFFVLPFIYGIIFRGTVILDTQMPLRLVMFCLNLMEVTGLMLGEKD